MLRCSRAIRSSRHVCRLLCTSDDMPGRPPGHSRTSCCTAAHLAATDNTYLRAGAGFNFGSFGCSFGAMSHCRCLLQCCRRLRQRSDWRLCLLLWRGRCSRSFWWQPYRLLGGRGQIGGRKGRQCSFPVKLSRAAASSGMIITMPSSLSVQQPLQLHQLQQCLLHEATVAGCLSEQQHQHQHAAPWLASFTGAAAELERETPLHAAASTTG